uniref:Uncharacterized protein n=1 Tax=viral metagenome TaxID=1070528 RepID=A0A6C0EK62_9ZZZZ
MPRKFSSLAAKYFDPDHVEKVAKSLLEQQTFRQKVMKNSKTTFAMRSRLRSLIDILSSAVTTYANLESFMDVVDLGYRFGYDRLNPMMVVFNALMFGFVLFNDWQFYLSTPLGMDMLYNLANDPARRQDFMNMIAHASILGVSPTDILAGIPQAGIVIMDDDSYLAMAANFGVKRAVYEVLSRL